MKHFLDLRVSEFKEWLTRHGQPCFRAGQVGHWVCNAPGVPFEQMSDIPKVLRNLLARDFYIWSMETVAHRTSPDGTEKLLLKTADGEHIECVLLRDDKGNRTACISTQVGCAMGCVFCASGLDGLVRNLTAGEIFEELLQLRRLLGPDERLSHIVVMGMGEPLANLERLLQALNWATRRDGLRISARRVTISTVGVPGGIRRLADRGAPYHLAVSLHAPNDELRSRIVPTNEKVGLRAILEAADYYFEKTGRRVTYEYVLLADVNDRPSHAAALAELLRGRNALVNLIPFNPIQGLPYRTPHRGDVREFASILDSAGVQVTIRHRKGDAIDAACGQLRRIRTEAVNHAIVQETA
ncbi:dual-specificity RNA methyltransferase RlmN [Thermopirellula anaerolimosa]